MKEIIGILHDNTSLTEDEAIEVLVLINKDYKNIYQMKPYEVLDIINDKTEFHDNKEIAWLDSEPYYSREELEKISHDLKSGRCCIYYNQMIDM
jgi:NAD-dependent dihydropyrimidine dehydrogenase PreA subunit